jgi:hypothetical protein
LISLALDQVDPASARRRRVDTQAILGSLAATPMWLNASSR